MVVITSSSWLHRSCWLLLTVVCFVIAGCEEASQIINPPDATTYSGQASVISGSINGVPVSYSDTGPLPSTGGVRETSALSAEVSGYLSLEVLHATTIGQGGVSRSEASVANFSLTGGNHTVAADLIMSRATAVCSGDQASVSGGSDIAALIVDGNLIQITFQPNQEVIISDTSGNQVGRVVINEQVSSVNGSSGEMRVNALHIWIDGFAEIVLAAAHADIHCGDVSVPGDDFITGGGWITGTPSGARANFGVAGGLRDGAFWGHLNYIDHDNPMLRVHGTGVTVYTNVSPTTRHIEGTAEIDGAPGTYSVDVTDNGEPGSNDVFSITLSTGYSASGTLGGGNIQLHTGG